MTITKQDEVQMIYVIVAGAAGLYYWWYHCSPMSDTWEPYANCERDSVDSYKRAAKLSGVRITVRGPVPAPAGRLMCSGMAGIWVHKGDLKDRNVERVFADAYFSRRVKETGQDPYNYDV